MASTNDKDIVQLRIDAENLAIDEINTTVDGLGDLGAASRKAQKDLEQLELSNETINSYKLVTQERARLRKEFDLAEVSYEKLSKAVKENKNATEEELLAVKSAKRELQDMGKVLRSQETEYNRLGRSLKQFGVDTKDLDGTQQQLQQQIKETSAQSAKLTEDYKQQITAVRQRIDVEKQAIATAKQAEASEKERQATIAKTAAEQEKLVESSRKLAAVEAAKITSQAKLNQSLTEYELALRELNAEVDDATLSTADYIREEERLRKSLELTEAQTKTIRNSLRAEIDDRKKVEKSLEAQALSQQKLTQQQTAAVQAERAAAVELDRVKGAVKEYELALEKLNREKTDGIISNGQYIRSENELRRSLQLTEAQVKLTRRATEADVVSRSNGAKNTDLLTQATRRLAQAYTVLLAAQKAAQAVTAGVTEYGELEAAITKVEKTTGVAREQTEKLAETLSDLAQNITPTATTELLRYAEIAGQLGTKSTGDLLNLVSAADALQNSTNLAGDEAVELLARVLTMTGEGIPAIQNLSSAVVALGNDFAASEADIVQMTKEIVAGTREIELSARAAAAIGTTLAELGQPAERSRTAIQRLAGVIKEATVKGGEDMERLALITKMTGEEIISSFGTEPEKILLAFLKGLDDINDSGGQMSTVLRQMGIEGSEALTVLGTLAGRTDRLETALKLSNEQWVAGNAHMKEAAKAYANQESALGRLSNKFGALKKDIGEAFSDETENAIQAVGDVIGETTDEVVSLMELLPEAVAGLTDTLGVLDNLLNTFSSDQSGFSALDNILGSIKISANTVTGAVNLMVLGLQGAIVATLELQKIGNEALGLKFDETGLNRYKELMRETKKSIDQDLADIADAQARMAGKSSIAFEGLKDAAEKYKGALSSLSAEQRASLQTILTKNEYSAAEDGLYRQLTASLVRANREQEIETQLKLQAAEASRQSAEAKQDEIGSIEQLVNAQIGINVSMTEYLAKSAVVEESIANVKALRDAAKISDEAAAVAIDGLSASLSQYNIVVAEQAETTERNTASTEDNLAARKELFQQYQDGAITEAELAASMSALSDNYTIAAQSVGTFGKAVEANTLGQAKFADEILQTKKKIDDYNATLKAGNLIAADRARITAALAVEEQKLKGLRTEQTQLIAIENATYGELVVMQRQYQQELLLLQRQFEAGSLTKAEYEARTRSLTEALNEINGVIRQNTDVVRENNSATASASAIQGVHTEAVKKSTAAVSLYGEASNYLNQQFDLSGKSIEQLNSRYDELTGKIWQNAGVTGMFWKTLANEFDKGFVREQAIIGQTLAVRSLTAELEKGSVSLKRLGDIGYYANNAMTSLSEQQLSPLLAAIQKAKDEIQSLNGVVDDALLNVQDRLDRALGNEESIIKRKFQQEMDEYLSLMDKAKMSGDAALVSRINEAIAKLKQAQDIEYSKQFGVTRPNAVDFNKIPTTKEVAPAVTPSGSSGASNGQMVVLQLQVGNTNYNAQMDQSSLSRLVSDIQRANKVGA